MDVACTVRASNLVQEHGMISNIFSGTLTRNEMKLVKFVIDGASYDVKYEEKMTTRADGEHQFGLMGPKEMNVEVLGEKKTYEVLAVNPFNADRKRMSILVKDVTTNQYFVMCKGADNIMLPLCLI
eukprot:gene526-702_t